MNEKLINIAVVKTDDKELLDNMLQELNFLDFMNEDFYELNQPSLSASEI